LVFVSPFFGFLKDSLGSVEPLDHIAEFFGLSESSPYIEVFPDYTVPSIGNPYISGLVAGLLGFFIVFGFSYLVAWLLARRE